MPLPDAVAAYFRADQTMDAEILRAAFAPHAIVHDEGADHVGIEAINAWWRAAKDKYHHSAEPLEESTDGDRVVVRAHVSGQFAGSPAMLDFRFVLADDRILSLEIG